MANNDLLPADAFGDLTYGTYLRIPELTELQTLLAGKGSHDELLFIIIHQTYELWFKQILFELDTISELLAVDNVHEARRLLDRVVTIGNILVGQIHILETMTPRDFLHFRKVLTPASGFQSVQFREIETICGLKDPNYLKYLDKYPEESKRLQARLDAPSLEDDVFALLERKGFKVGTPSHEEAEVEKSARALKDLFLFPQNYPELYALCEAMVGLDQFLSLWRFHHLRTVQRVIGSKPGTGGSPGVEYLASTLNKRAFPALWAARALLDDGELYGTYEAPVTEGCPFGHGKG